MKPSAAEKAAQAPAPAVAVTPQPVPTQNAGAVPLVPPPIAPLQQVVLEQGQQAPAAAEPKQKQQPEKYATCAEATDKVPGFALVKEALANCPDLQAMQNDPNTAKTFFVPSDKVSQ